MMSTEIAETESRDKVLLTVIEHWAKARIEAPLHLISRQDDSAKQIITVAGVLQGALIAIAKVGENPLTLAGLAASTCLLVCIVSAAYVIKVPPDDLWAHRLYEDLRCARDDLWLEKQLDGQFKEWCTSVSAAAVRKQKHLTFAIMALTLGLAMSVVCLLDTYGWKPY